MIWLEMSGSGKLLINAFGMIYPVEVDGEYIVDTGNIAAFEDSLDFKISKAGRSWLLLLCGRRRAGLPLQGEGDRLVSDPCGRDLRIQAETPSDTQEGEIGVIMENTKSDYTYTIDASPDFSMANITIPKGSSLKAEAAAMAYMDSSLKMKARMKGGVKRMLAGGVTSLSTSISHTPKMLKSGSPREHPVRSATSIWKDPPSLCRTPPIWLPLPLWTWEWIFRDSRGFSRVRSSL